MNTPIIDSATLSEEQNKEYKKCHHYCKGGWCGIHHEQEITITKKGMSKRIISLRCSEWIRRKGECKDFFRKE